ncbi:MAG TPA: glycosyltransferase [Candidatus Saccharimonadales bacterium]|nr:glycosyltransferase [Candidatus Saccharimonadales bacterium]
MRILLGTLSYPPNISGVAVSVEILAKFLAEQGHEVHVVVPNTGSKTAAGEKIDGIIIHRVRAFSNPIRPGFYLPFFTKTLTRRLIDEIKPDVVHVHDPMAMSRYLQYWANRRDIPTIVSNHFMLDYIISYIPKPLKNITRPYLTSWIVRFYNRCQTVIAPSETVANYLRQLGVTVPVRALSNGVDLERFFAVYNPTLTRTQFGLSEAPIILYVGRLDRDKSIDVLIRALEVIRQKAWAQLVIVGGGRQKNRFVRQVKKLNFERDVSFVGSIPHKNEKLVALYDAAAVFVMPSSIETQSIVTLEAMAASRPVVAARGGALMELVKDRQNGLMFEPNHPEELAEKVVELLKDSKLCAKLARGGVETATRHGLTKSLALFQKLYEEVA